MKRTKFVSVLIAITFLLSAVTPAFAALPEDAIGNKAESAIGKLMAVGIVEGYEDGTIRPEGTITRAEFAKIAVVAMGLEEAAKAVVGTTNYSDTVAGAWYTGFINIATTNSLLKGYPNGTFQPNAKISNNEAITILVRMLGLGPVVEKTGTWPSNYIGRGANLGVLKGVNPVGSADATRGDVFRMLDNSLQIAMWGSTGYNSDGTVQYGPLGTTANPETLLGEKLDIKEYTVRVTGYDVDKSELTVTGGGPGAPTGSQDVTWSGSLYDAYLNDVVIWYNSDDEIVYFEVDSDYYVDAIEVNAAGTEIELIGADKTLDVDNPAATDFIDNGSTIAFSAASPKYDYAKVVLNDDGDVVRVDALNWDGFLVVEKTDKTIVEAYGESEDLKDYVIIKDGKTVSVDDLKKNDILFFNASEEFAEVYNKSVSGEISRIFSTSFRVDGNDYEYSNPNLPEGVKYLDADGEIADYTTDAKWADIAEAFQDEGKVEVFTDRYGEAVYVAGDLGAIKTSSFLAYVWKDSASFNDRGTAKSTLEVFTENGVLISYDVTDADVTGYATSWASGSAFRTDIKQGAIVEITIDKDSKIDDIELIQATGGGLVSIDTKDRYVGGSRLKSDAVVFMTEDFLKPNGDEDDLKVSTYGKLDFDTITQAVPAVVGTDVVAIDAQKTTSSPDTSTYWAVAMSSTSKVSGKDIYYIDLIVEDWAKDEYIIDAGYALNAAGIAKGQYVFIELEDGTNNIVNVDQAYATTSPLATPTPAVKQASTTIDAGSIDVRDKEFKLGGVTKKLVSDAIILDKDYKIVSLRDLDDTKNFEWLEEAANFVRYIRQIN